MLSNFTVTNVDQIVEMWVSSAPIWKNVFILLFQEWYVFIGVGDGGGGEGVGVYHGIKLTTENFQVCVLARKHTYTSENVALENTLSGQIKGPSN